VWISIRWWLLPKQSTLLRFQGVLGVIGFIISIGVIAGIDRDRRMFAQLLADNRAGEDADAGTEGTRNADESAAQ
jgi:hypothetical protein